MTSTRNTFGHETVASDVLSGKGKRFVVEASDDTATGHGWGVRIWELQNEPGRPNVRNIRMHTKTDDRIAAVTLAEQVIAKINEQLSV